MDNSEQSTQPSISEQSEPVSQQAPKKSAKTLIFSLLAILVIVGGAGFAYVLNQTPTEYESEANSSPKRKQPIATPLPPTSDAQLDKDAQSLEVSLKSLDSEVENIDDGLNDKPTDLSE